MPRLVIAVLVGAATLAGAASADAAIVINRSIAGVEIGDSERAVRAELGRPSSVSNSGGFRTLRYRRKRIDVFLTRSSRRVFEITTTSTRQRTRSGVRVGISYRQLRRLLRGERCTSTGSLASCTVSSRRRVTRFVSIGNRVRSIALSRPSPTF
jgi:hypothetical protein